MVISVKPLQSAKADFPISSTPSSIVNAVISWHHRYALLGMILTVPGIIGFLMPDLLNAAWPNVVMVEGNVSSFREAHASNARSSIVVSPSGRITSLRLRHDPKVSCLMESIPEGITIVLRAVHSENTAPSYPVAVNTEPSTVSDSGSFTEVRLVH